MTTDIDQLLQKYSGSPSREEFMYGECADARILAEEVRFLASRLKEAEAQLEGLEELVRWYMDKLERQEAEVERRRMDLAGEPYHHHVTATPPNQEEAGIDFEKLRKDSGWPTPIAMRRAADGFDTIGVVARYGDVLRWVADACDGILNTPPNQEDDDA